MGLVSRTDVKNRSDNMPNMKEIPKQGNFEHSQFPRACDSPVEGNSIFGQKLWCWAQVHRMALAMMQ